MEAARLRGNIREIGEVGLGVRSMPMASTLDFIVNTTKTGTQVDPSVAALADGRLVVTWAADDPSDGLGFSICGRLYNADGSAAGNDFIINSTTTSSQFLQACRRIMGGSPRCETECLARRRALGAVARHDRSHRLASRCPR